jgi:hypothetical protein
MPGPGKSCLPLSNKGSLDIGLSGTGIGKGFGLGCVITFGSLGITFSSSRKEN